MTSQLRIAVIGMGGFAAAHHDAIALLEAEGVCQLQCTCDPAMDLFTERRRQLQFAERGVRQFTDYLSMLDACRDELDVVTIPTPIPWHAPMHRACVERGLAVYLEKPPTLDAVELEAMLTVEARAARATMVGFNYIVEAERQALKYRLVQGEFGTPRSVAIYGHWPRNTAYFQRADWAGRLLLNDRLVLDSCMGNALAHNVHNGLFWAGARDVWAWGEVDRVEAELYRAHAIQGTDTVFLRAEIADGPELRIAMSHACAGESQHYERVICDEAEITYIINRPCAEGTSVIVRWRDGREERIPTPPTVFPVLNLRTYCAYLNGELPRPVTRLADCRPFVELNDLAYLAAGKIVTVPASCCEEHLDGYRAITGIEQAMECFSHTGAFPSTQRLPWAVAGGHATRTDLPRLAQTIYQMA